MKIEYKFHTPHFDEVAERIEEPEETLEELLKQYEESCRQFSEFQKKKREAEAPYRRTRINADGKEENYIDYKAWEKEDSESCWTFGLGDFNGFNAIDMMEDMIDAKIYYMNKMEQED
ncbi:MAG: hypothetical protein II683_05065 [Muribaculaceae bacterium]|nr:hypothetical protein [Muribaculaceae bacterium]